MALTLKWVLRDEMIKIQLNKTSFYNNRSLAVMLEANIKKEYKNIVSDILTEKKPICGKLNKNIERSTC